MSLSFEADLKVTGPAGDLTITSDGDGALVVTTDQLRPLVQAMRSDELLPSGALRTVGSVADLLSDTGATVHLRTPSTALATLGSGAVPTGLARAVGLRHVQITSWRGVVAALRPSGRSAAPLAAAAGVVLAVVLRRLRLGRAHQPGGQQRHHRPHRR